MRSEDFKMPVGKYKGLTLEEIKEVAPSYLEWIYDNFEEDIQSEEIRTHIENVVDV